jgi:hypothetical protein
MILCSEYTKRDLNDLQKVGKALLQNGNPDLGYMKFWSKQYLRGLNSVQDGDGGCIGKIIAQFGTLCFEFVRLAM